MTHAQELQQAPRSGLAIICPEGYSIGADCWIDTQKAVLRIYPQCHLCYYAASCKRANLLDPITFHLHRSELGRTSSKEESKHEAARYDHRWRWKIFLRSGKCFYAVWYDEQFCPGTITIAKHHRFGIHVYVDLFSAMEQVQRIGFKELDLVVYPVYIPRNAVRMESQSYDRSVEAWDRVQVPTIEEVRKMLPMDLLGWNQGGETRNESLSTR